MQKGLKSFLIGLGVIIVSVVFILLVQKMIFKPKLDLEWHHLNSNEFNLYFKMGPSFGEDPIPEISIKDHKWKIIHPTKNAISVVWQVQVNIGAIPLDKIPAKYREKRKAGKFTILPSTNLPYELQVTIHFFDKDGFEIIEDTKTETIVSGESEVIRGEFEVSLEKALRLHRSSISILVMFI